MNVTLTQKQYVVSNLMLPHPPGNTIFNTTAPSEGLLNDLMAFKVGESCQVTGFDVGALGHFQELPSRTRPKSLLTLGFSDSFLASGYDRSLSFLNHRGSSVIPDRLPFHRRIFTAGGSHAFPEDHTLVSYINA